MPQQGTIGDTQREEIQRYFGYEILPFRYLSLPYDASVNANENALSIEIGFIYFAFLPLLVLLYFYHKTWFRILILLTILFVWIIGSANSYVFSFEGVIHPSGRNEMVDYLLSPISFLKEPSAHITAYFYYLSSLVYDPIESLAELVSGDEDFITYPLLVLLLLVSYYILHRELRNVSIANRIIVSVFWLFFFLWLKFSAGIVWYGFAMLTIGLVLILKLIQIGNPKFPRATTFLRYLFFINCSIWISGAILLRFGEVNNNAEASDLGKAMFNQIFYKYQIGELDDYGVLTQLYTGGFEKALARMNSENESRILRIGTSFSYFIKENSKRVFIDNQLGLFEKVRSEIKDKEDVIEAFESSGFKYIIVDVNTPFIDDTPEGTLRKKYDRLIFTIRDNPKLKLIATNRIFAEKMPNGQNKLYYRMFPDKTKNMEIFYGGQYGIYEIIP